MKLCDDFCICFPKRREKRARRDPGCLLLVMEEARPAGPVHHLFLKGCECHLSNSIGKMKHDRGPSKFSPDLSPCKQVQFLSCPASTSYRDV